MSERHVLVIDEGTTGTRAVLVDRHSEIVAQAYQEFTQYHPADDRVEHDPEEIWQVTKDVCLPVVEKAHSLGAELAAVAISNQRATSVLWDKRTGEPVDRAIVWQDQRTASMVDALEPEWGERVYDHTGLILNPACSSLMLAWWLDKDPALRARAERGELAFGTIDSWLKTDGGAAQNDFLLQFQADLLDVEVERPRNAEFTTCLGAAYMAGLATGIWKDRQEVIANRAVDRTFTPEMDDAERERLYHAWHEAVSRSANWLRDSRI